MKKFFFFLSNENSIHVSSTQEKITHGTNWISQFWSTLYVKFIKDNYWYQNVIMSN